MSKQLPSPSLKAGHAIAAAPPVPVDDDDAPVPPLPLEPIEGVMSPHAKRKTASSKNERRMGLGPSSPARGGASFRMNRRPFCGCRRSS
jgi:hypothetical protein